MNERILQPINLIHTPQHPQEETILQPLKSDEDEQHPAIPLEETPFSGSQNATALPENTLSTQTTNVEATVPVAADAVKATTVSSNNGLGWKILGGVALLGGVGAAVAGGGGSKSKHTPTQPHPTDEDAIIGVFEVSIDAVPDQLSTQQQTVQLSGSLKNVGTDATVTVAVKVNNGMAKMAKVSGSTWTLDVPANEMVAQLGENRIDVTAIFTDKLGNNTQHSVSDVFHVYVPTETQIFYASGKMDSVSGSTAQAFDGKGLSDSGKILKNENEMLQRYMIAKGATTIEKNIEKAYAADRDKDGVIDAFDRNPNTWDVSERDLRMFASLAYTDGDILKRAFNDKNQAAIEQILLKKYFLNQFTFQDEAIGKWDVLKAESQSNGLDYAIFGNGKKANGSYENVVVAFRGTEGLTDAWNDLQLTLKGKPDQVFGFDEIATNLMQQYQPKNVYATGHSLGGYLSQYFAAYTMQQTADRRTAFKHNAIFNPAKITASENSSISVQEALETSEQFYQTKWIDNSDKTETVNKLKSNSYVIDKEWVSAGIPLLTVLGTALVSPTIAFAMAGFRGLGKYPNTTNFTFKSGDLWGKHSMTSFYEKDESIKQHFSKGYRIDKNYLSDDTDRDGFTDFQEKRIGTDFRTATNLNGKDTDQDGFSDHLEIKLGSQWQNADDIVEVSDFVAQSEWGSPILAVAATHTSDNAKTFLGATGYLLSPTAKGNDLSYTPNGETVDLGIANHTEWQTWVNAGKHIQNGTNNNDTLSGSNVAQILYGGDGNDILNAGSAQTVLLGGKGSDTFTFSAAHLLSGSLNIVGDLTSDDKLDFSGSRELFNDRNDHFKWSDVLGETVSAFDNASALIWQDDSKTLAYKSSQSHDLHVFARFDDSQTWASLQAALLA